MKRKTPAPATGSEKMDAPLNIDDGSPSSPLPNPPDTFTAEQRAEHEGFMREALAIAEWALVTDETPVACVLVKDGKTIARGMNATNRTMNGTRHAEFQAIASILSQSASSPIAEPLPEHEVPQSLKSALPPLAKPKQPYGPDVLKECTLYVTVEPCIMCASLLRQFGVPKVYFGAANDRFGGTGGVMDMHSCPAVDPPYWVSGGWLREEAIVMLRRFYVQTNEKAPIPRPKRERVLKLEVEAAGTPVNRVVGKVEALVQKAQAKREIKKAGDSATTVEEKLDLVEERRVIEMNEKADEP